MLVLQSGPMVHLRVEVLSGDDVEHPSTVERRWTMADGVYTRRGKTHCVNATSRRFGQPHLIDEVAGEAGVHITGQTARSKELTWGIEWRTHYQYNNTGDMQDTHQVQHVMRRGRINGAAAIRGAGHRTRPLTQPLNKRYIYGDTEQSTVK